MSDVWGFEGVALAIWFWFKGALLLVTTSPENSKGNPWWLISSPSWLWPFLLFFHHARVIMTYMHLFLGPHISQYNRLPSHQLHVIEIHHGSPLIYPRSSVSNQAAILSRAQTIPSKTRFQWSFKPIGRVDSRSGVFKPTVHQMKYILESFKVIRSRFHSILSHSCRFVAARTHDIHWGDCYHWTSLTILNF